MTLEGKKGAVNGRENWVVQTLRKCVFCACTAHLNQANVAINCFAVLLIMTLQNVLFPAATPIVVASYATIFIRDAFFDPANSKLWDLNGLCGFSFQGVSAFAYTEIRYCNVHVAH